MTITRISSNTAEAYDLGYLAGVKHTRQILLDVRYHLEALIDRAVIRGEFDSLVHARQILRKLK